MRRGDRQRRHSGARDHGGQLRHRQVPAPQSSRIALHLRERREQDARHDHRRVGVGQVHEVVRPAVQPKAGRPEPPADDDVVDVERHVVDESADPRAHPEMQEVRKLAPGQQRSERVPRRDEQRHTRQQRLAETPPHQAPHAVAVEGHPITRRRTDHVACRLIRPALEVDAPAQQRSGNHAMPPERKAGRQAAENEYVRVAHGGGAGGGRHRDCRGDRETHEVENVAPPDSRSVNDARWIPRCPRRSPSGRQTQDDQGSAMSPKSAGVSKRARITLTVS